jgi:hypothetical protein
MGTVAMGTAIPTMASRAMGTIKILSQVMAMASHQCRRPNRRMEKISLAVEPAQRRA